MDGGHDGQLLDNPRTAGGTTSRPPGITEGQDEILRQAPVRRRLELTATLGKDPSTWRWGELHQLVLQHPVLGGDRSPPAAGPSTRWPIEPPGGSSIVDANGWDACRAHT